MSDNEEGGVIVGTVTCPFTTVCTTGEANEQDTNDVAMGDYEDNGTSSIIIGTVTCPFTTVCTTGEANKEDRNEDDDVMMATVQI